jgi:NAD(P)-dependent dehydrogenase (short-subunit alcohol dehydrogenase family)
VEVTGKVAIVTGSGGEGSGRAIARRFARDGAKVVVCDINEPGGRETVRLIEGERGRAAFVRADVANKDDLANLFAFAETTFGGVDILVNNASDLAGSDDPLGEWFDAIQIDLLGTMHATLLAVEAMRRRGGGAIVNIGSTSALGHGYKHGPWPGYDVAKAGVIRLTTTLARLAESEKIRVNCLVPSWVASPEVQAYVDSLTPDKRRARGAPDTLISLDEIADAVSELATDERLAGRVMVWWNGQPRRLISREDRGYAALE